jgi:hypothetical protein
MRLEFLLVAGLMLAACVTASEESRSARGATLAEPVAASAPAPQPSAADDTEITAAAASGAEATTNADAEGLICKRVSVTGSRFTRKVCYTAKEWARFESAAEEFMREINRQPTGAMPM